MVREPRFTSFKFGYSEDKTLRITAYIAPTNLGGQVKVAFGFQSPRDEDCKKHGQEAAIRAYNNQQYLFVEEKNLTHESLMVLALAASLTSYPGGVKAVRPIIYDIYSSWVL